MDITNTAQEKNQEVRELNFNKLKDLNPLFHTFNKPKGCIYSPIGKPIRWNNNIAVAIQSRQLDQDLERQN